MGSARSGRAVKLLTAFYFLEAGSFLLLAPWSRLWAHRVVLPSPLALQPFLASSHFRGFLAGIGLLHLFVALRELRTSRDTAPV